MKKCLLILAGAVLLLTYIVVAAGKDNPQNDPRADLIFSHVIHLKDAGMSCKDCHQSAENSTVPTDRLLPSMDVCGSCHDVKDSKSCGICHRTPQAVAPVPYEMPNYHFFSHQEHLGTNLNCGTCHAGAEKSTQVTEAASLLPRMADCVNCHRKDGQALDCSACHTGLHPRSDDYDIMARRTTHGLDAALDPDKYRQYFEPGDCEDCHQGLNLAGEVHPQGWIFVHAAEASAGAECLICHEDRTFCSSCHRVTIPIPHPLGDPTFANSEEGGSHTDEATAFFEVCVSCHDLGTTDPTCARCH